MGFSVSLEHVGKRYQDTGPGTAALSDMSVTIEGGSVVAITGPSGSGKSTLLHLLGAMDSANEGEIRVGPTVVTRLTGREQALYRRTIGFVFQRFHLLPALSVVENVAVPILPYRTDFDKFERARELVSAVGLAGRETTLPSRLSGGEQQRVALARALINEPGLLLADEPTGNLDSKTGTEIVDMLLELRAHQGMTVLVATHDPLVATRCDRILTLRDGRLSDDLTVRSDGGDGLLEVIERLDPHG